jgi:uncharacterized protein (DUF433 family)
MYILLEKLKNKGELSTRSPAAGRWRAFMDWKERIHSDKSILLGKPVIKGTRISVEFIVERLANGWTEQQLLDNYSRLTKEDLQAVFAYVYECIHDSLLYTIPKKTA